MNPADKRTLLTAGKRWMLLALASYAVLSIAYYVARVYFSAPFLPQSDYETPVFIGLSITVSGLYSAALALRAERTRGVPSESAHS